jgi:hypothetical protein
MAIFVVEKIRNQIIVCINKVNIMEDEPILITVGNKFP